MFPGTCYLGFRRPRSLPPPSTAHGWCPRSAESCCPRPATPPHTRAPPSGGGSRGQMLWAGSPGGEGGKCRDVPSGGGTVASPLRTQGGHSAGCEWPGPVTGAMREPPCWGHCAPHGDATEGWGALGNTHMPSSGWGAVASWVFSNYRGSQCPAPSGRQGPREDCGGGGWREGGHVGEGWGRGAPGPGTYVLRGEGELAA